MAEGFILNYENLFLPMGPIRGCIKKTIYGDEYYSFEGIPYAEPPLHELRFKAPLPADPWKTVLNCLKCDIKAMQVNPHTGSIEGIENCLYLNVYVKKVSINKPLPVMVWIHGGGFSTGAVTTSLYSPDYFMKQDIVLVTLNYRLCAFGFLSVDDPSLEIPGNAGLKDQILALKWVREFITYLNGDSNNITVFGANAGAVSTHYLTCTPTAKGLFHKAICISGSMLNSWAITSQKNMAYRLAQFNGYKGENIDSNVVDFLQKLHPEDLVKHDILTNEEHRNSVLFPFGPCVESYVGADCVIPIEPRVLLRTSWGNYIPMIFSGTANEGYLMYRRLKLHPEFMNTFNDDPGRILPAEVMEEDEEESLEKARRLVRVHFGSKTPSSKCVHEFLDFYGFKMFWHGYHRTLLSRVSYAKGPTYLYRFAFDSPTFNHHRKRLCNNDLETGVAHSDDISYLWYGDYAWKLKKSSREYRTIERMVGILTAFAKSSNPNCEEIKDVIWLPLAHTEPNLALNIADDLKFDIIPEKEKLEIWDSLYEPGELY